MTVYFYPKSFNTYAQYDVKDITYTDLQNQVIRFRTHGGLEMFSSGIPFLVMADDVDSVGLRKEVFNFAQSMENVLRANEHKGHWRGASTQRLLAKLEEEYQELRLAVLDHEGAEAVLHEATDLANVAMMLADNEGK